MKETKGNFIKISEIINRSKLFLDQDLLSSIISLKHFSLVITFQKCIIVKWVSVKRRILVCVWWLLLSLLFVFFCWLFFFSFFGSLFVAFFPSRLKDRHNKILLLKNWLQSDCLRKSYQVKGLFNFNLDSLK